MPPPDPDGRHQARRYQMVGGRSEVGAGGRPTAVLSVTKVANRPGRADAAIPTDSSLPCGSAVWRGKQRYGRSARAGAPAASGEIDLNGSCLICDC